MRITVDVAKEFFRSQGDLNPDEMHDDGIEYWAGGPVCVAFHRSFWPDIWMAHLGAKPEGWGQTLSPTEDILNAFWGERKPARITGWINEKNRQALHFTRRLGFVEDGRLVLPTETIIMQGWSKCH